MYWLPDSRESCRTCGDIFAHHTKQIATVSILTDSFRARVWVCPDGSMGGVEGFIVRALTDRCGALSRMTTTLDKGRGTGWRIAERQMQCGLAPHEATTPHRDEDNHGLDIKPHEWTDADPTPREVQPIRSSDARSGS